MIVCFMLFIEFISYYKTYASVVLEQAFVLPFVMGNLVRGLGNYDRIPLPKR